MRAFLKRKLIDPVVNFLKQGVSPSKLAFAVSLSVVIAVVPIFGASTLLCLAVIWLFRLNPGAVLFVNQIFYPLQFLLYFPLIRSGEWLFSESHPIPLSISQIFVMFRDDLPAAIATLWWSTLYATTVWIIIGIPTIYLIYLTLIKIFTRIDTKLKFSTTA